MEASILLKQESEIWLECSIFLDTYQDLCRIGDENWEIELSRNDIISIRLTSETVIIETSENELEIHFAEDVMLEWNTQLQLWINEEQQMQSEEEEEVELESATHILQELDQIREGIHNHFLQLEDKWSQNQATEHSELEVLKAELAQKTKEMQSCLEQIKKQDNQIEQLQVELENKNQQIAQLMDQRSSSSRPASSSSSGSQNQMIQALRSENQKLKQQIQLVNQGISVWKQLHMN